jgi:cysteine-rich repeat protein
LGEECDDGNNIEDDGCSAGCRLPVCGDSIVQVTEECDDGNLEDGDDCLSDCTISLLPMIGDECDVNFLFQCVPAPDSNAGTPLLCQEGLLTATDQFAQACMGLCSMGSSIPVEACGGWGEYAICLCELDMPQSCDGAQLGCAGDMLTLCHEGQVVLGWCPDCAMVDGYHTCNW